MTDFELNYWKTNYSEPETMDGVFNAHAHANYLKSLFDLEEIKINSMIDYGHGLGELTCQMYLKFMPTRMVAIDCSNFAYKQLKYRQSKGQKFKRLELEKADIKSWLIEHKEERFDLGICSSVFQYINNKDLSFILPIMAKQVKYLYLTVPTNLEQENMQSDLEFVDELAYSRTQKQYLKLIRPYFSIVSSRLLESKIYFDEKSTFFTNLLFRF